MEWYLEEVPMCLQVKSSYFDVIAMRLKVIPSPRFLEVISRSLEQILRYLEVIPRHLEVN